MKESSPVSVCQHLWVDREWGRWHSPHCQNQHPLHVQTPTLWWGELPQCLSSGHVVSSASSSSDLQAADPPFPPPFSPSLSLSWFLREFASQMISRTSNGTKPLFFPLATLIKPLRSPSLLTQIWWGEEKCIEPTPVWLILLWVHNIKKRHRF